MKGWIFVNVMSHGDYFRDLVCCEGKEIKITKRRKVKSRNSQEDYYKCSGCGQEFMEKHQTFICPHNLNKKSNDGSYTLYIKKTNPNSGSVEKGKVGVRER